MQTPEIHSNIPNLHETEKCMYHTNITQIKGKKKDNIKENISELYWRDGPPFFQPHLVF